MFAFTEEEMARIIEESEKLANLVADFVRAHKS
jgi:hypothetical protein